MRNPYQGGEFRPNPGSLVTCHQLGVMIGSTLDGPHGEQDCPDTLIVGQNVNERARAAKGQPYVACATHLTVGGQR